MWNANATIRQLPVPDSQQQPRVILAASKARAPRCLHASHVMRPSCPPAQMQIIARNLWQSPIIATDRPAPAKKQPARYWPQRPSLPAFRRLRTQKPRWRVAPASPRRHDVTSAPYISRLGLPFTATRHREQQQPSAARPEHRALSRGRSLVTAQGKRKVTLAL